MAATKECKTCGAQNDVIFTNCTYCKASLPQIDINSISTEDLIMKCGEWIAKVKGMVEGGGGLRIESRKEAIGLAKFLPSIKNIDEIAGITEKYIRLLEIRAVNNPTLQITVQELKSEISNAIQKAKNKKKKTLVILLGIFFLLLISLQFNLSNEDKTEKAEIDRLYSIELKIGDAIKEKNYDYALILTNQLTWSDNDVDGDVTERQRIYNKKREEYTKTISDLKKEK